MNEQTAQPSIMTCKVYFSLLFCFVTINSRAQKNIPVYQSDQLVVEKLKGGIYRHISFLSTEDFGKVRCNGMIVTSGKDALIVDTPTNDAVSKELIDWVEETLEKKVISVVTSHFHQDCLGGLGEFHTRNIPSFASFKTIELAQLHNNPMPQNGFGGSLEITVGQLTVLNQYLGEGHTVDNIVVYVPEKKVLFGGCLIKSMGAEKGYLGDANIKEWPQTVTAAKSKFGSAKIVIPGHGPPGNLDLLYFTIALFEHP